MIKLYGKKNSEMWMHRNAYITTGIQTSYMVSKTALFPDTAPAEILKEDFWISKSW